MNKRKKRSALTGPIVIVLILIAAMLGLRLCFFRETFTPLALRQQAATDSSCRTVNAFFDAVLSGDAVSAEKLSANLSFEEWDCTGEMAELSKSCFQAEILSSEVNRDGSVKNTVSIRWLNADKMTDGIEEEIQTAICERLASAKDSSDVYDEELKFRQDVVRAEFDAALARRIEARSDYIEESSVTVETTGEAEPRVIVSDELFNILANGRGNG